VNRRALMFGTVAVLAGAAGVGGAWWRSRGTGAGTTPGAAHAASGEVDIWSRPFQTPQGTRLDLAALRGKPLLLNFWATWCPPCVGELPLLDRFHREQAGHGWQVVGLAVDNLGPVTEFLGKRPVGFPIGLAGMEGVELARQLGNTGGALPFTVVFDRAGHAVARKLGVIAPEDLAQWVASVA
jgi:thiol-disulfide isomerase/thioredoxin